MNENEAFFEELQRDVDADHRRVDGASAPPADVWKSIRAQVNLQPKEANQMSSITMTAIPVRSRRPVDSRPRGGIGHYLNLAATIALVVAVAVAGWFAASRLNGPIDPDRGFGWVGSTPISNSNMTCDVEPLTQERVLEIVKNPIPFVANGPAGEPEYISVVLPESAELYEADYPVEPVPDNAIPSREQFGATEEFANEYLECLLVGTQGQVWNFYSPTSIQSTILADFPVFSSEEDVTARISERLTMPAVEGEWLWQDLPMLDLIKDVSVNPDRNLAILNVSRSVYFDQMLTFGVVLRDADGTAMVHTNGTGRNLVPNDPSVTGINDIYLRITLVKARDGNTWLVLPSPSAAELGNFFD